MSILAQQIESFNAKPPAMRRTATAAGISTTEAQNLYRQVTQGMENAPPVTIVREAAQLPFDAPSDVKGVYHSGVVYLVSSNLASVVDGRNTIVHEVIGHFGLRGYFGKGLGAVLVKIHRSNVKVQMATAKWKAANQDMIAQWKRDYGVSDQWVHERAIEEALADMAGKGVAVKAWHELAAKLQDLLRKAGMDGVANWIEGKTDAQAMLALKNGEAFVRSGATAQEQKSDNQHTKELPTLLQRAGLQLPRKAEDIVSGTAPSLTEKNLAGLWS